MRFFFTKSATFAVIASPFSGIARRPITPLLLVTGSTFATPEIFCRSFVSPSAALASTRRRIALVVGEPLLKLLRGAVSDDLAFVDDNRAAADRLDLFQYMGGYDDGLFRGHVVNEFAHMVLLIGVEPIGGLVENENLRVVQDRLRQPDPALVAFRQRFDALVHYRADLGVLDRPVDAFPAFLSIEPAYGGDEIEKRAGSHIAV